jgi:signal transduction histidine kinase
MTGPLPENARGAGAYRISLRNYIALIYTLFICFAIFILSIVIHFFAGKIFSEYIRDNIKAQNEEIVRSFTEQYDPAAGRFDIHGMDAMGMHFLHQGYLISLEDTGGKVMWDARASNMQQCSMVINEIAGRMEREYQISGAFEINRQPLVYRGDAIGQINIETYGPFFYSENESGFLNTLNRSLFVTGVVFLSLSVAVSIFLATALARPILRAADAARHIAGGNLAVRVPEKHAPRELYELSRSINELAEALEQGERRQKRLTSDIAHELRTPLTTLQGNIEAMIDGVWEPTAERLTSCHEEIIRLHKLVEDLNLLSILEKENLVLHKTDFDLAKLIASVTGQFLPLAREKGIALSARSAASPLYADYDRLMQVFINLLSNAVKYTDRGAVTVEVKPLEEAGRRCYAITVADTGIGIGEEDLPHIFQRFYRSDKSRNRGSGGAGIGLSIAAAIAAAHGGRIEAASVPGMPAGGDSAGDVYAGAGKGKTGSIFTVVIPARS